MIKGCAIRGRSNGEWQKTAHQQRLEIGVDIANSITSVNKDSMIIEYEEIKTAHSK